MRIGNCIRFANPAEADRRPMAWMHRGLDGDNAQEYHAKYLFLSPPKPSKIELWRGLGGVFEESWDVLGGVGASWTRLGHALSASGSARGRLGGVLGPSWGVLGGSCRGLGESRKLPGCFLEVFLEVFMLS